MMATERASQVQCPARLFVRAEEEVARTVVALNRAAASQKLLLARMLLGAAQELAGCTRRDLADAGCRRCGRFAELRRRTAALILRAETTDETLRPGGLHGGRVRKPILRPERPQPWRAAPRVPG